MNRWRCRSTTDRELVENVLLAVGPSLLTILVAVAAWSGCASVPIRDWCPTSFDTWAEAGYGENRYAGRDVDYWGDVSSRSRGRGSDWSSRAGVSVHWDVTGSCWDYEEEEDPAGPEAGAPDPGGAGSPGDR